MARPSRWLFLVLLILFSSGCLYYGQSGLERPAPRQYLNNPTAELRQKIYFDYTPLAEDPEIVKITDKGAYEVRKLHFPTHTAYFYDPKRPIPAPGVVVLPISNGNYHADQMASYFASHGFACLRFKTRKEILGASKDEEPLNAFENNLRAYVTDILQGIDWLSAHPKVDADRLGLVGISLGALTGSIVSGLDPRIKASVYMLGGGDLTGILLSSKEKSVRRIRESLKKREGITPQEIQQIINTRLRPLEPLIYADRQDPSRILMINALLDQVIKRKYTRALWKAYGKPSMIEVPTGHYSSMIFLPYAKHKALQHFQKLLGVDPAISSRSIPLKGPSSD